MIKILYISNSMPYDKIRHGGGQTFNYYVKSLLKEKNIEIKVVAYCKWSEKDLLDADKYKIDIYPVYTIGKFTTNLKRIITDIAGYCFFGSDIEESYYKKKNILKRVLEIKKNGYEPNVIVLEWTNLVVLIEDVKKIFPYSKYIASEHDVSFLGAERLMIRHKGKPKEYKLHKKYIKLKTEEINSLNLCDIVMPHNFKDKNLLIENGIKADKIHVLTPYYHNMGCIKRENINKDILFWGAMHRQENYDAALWFIDNVMPLINDKKARFVVVGNNPPKKLTERQNERIIVTGFVEDETEYFAHSLCFVAPLLTGAGIKIKVIEAMSAGIPILTNDIGIEGIPAENGITYFHCYGALDYAKIIKKLINNEINTSDMIIEQRKIIETYFDLNKSKQSYIKLLGNYKSIDIKKDDRK